MVRICMRPRYSPRMPSANNCAPEKMAMIEARNGKPATVVPLMRNRPSTYASTARPNSVNVNPTSVAS